MNEDRQTGLLMTNNPPAISRFNMPLPSRAATAHGNRFATLA